MPSEERVIEDSEEDYESYSDSDSSHGLNHSEYLRLAREHMKDLRHRTKHQSGFSADQLSVPNSNERLRREIDDAQEDLQSAFQRLREAPTLPLLGGISEISTRQETNIPLTYPESLELPPACPNVSASQEYIALSHSDSSGARTSQYPKLFHLLSDDESSAHSDKGDSDENLHTSDETDINKRPMLPPPNPPHRSQGGLPFVAAVDKDNVMHDYKDRPIHQDTVTPPSQPESRQSPDQSSSRPKQFDIANDEILFPPFPVSSSLAETVIISSSLPIEVHDDHDGPSTRTKKPVLSPPHSTVIMDKKRKQLVDEGGSDCEAIAKKPKVQTTLQAEMQLISVMHNEERGMEGRQQTTQKKVVKGRPGPALFKQPAVRVGLSKRDRVDSLHAYLRR
ncbi:hypothetical protein V1517DRAFT_323338 [Lipomyces orientalis]|uniref:Uncharacterized protein n=1 Tax=Lipomyces orientalis TaxID=1233043 RepID=A0ACC3TMZ6_9ASCO